MVIAVEGIGGSGKTTLTKELSKLGYMAIPEIRDAYPETAEVQVFTLETEKSYRVNLWFLQKEYLRTVQIKDCAVPVVMDRCFVSLIAYNYAKDAVYSTSNLSSIKELIGEYVPSLIRIPYLVYLCCNVDVAIERMMQRNKDNHKEKYIQAVNIYTKNFNLKLKEYYDLLSERLKSSLLIVDSETPLKEKTQQVYEWVKTKPTKYPSIDFFQLFLDE